MPIKTLKITKKVNLSKENLSFMLIFLSRLMQDKWIKSTNQPII